jgi:hypothetical protein
MHLVARDDGGDGRKGTEYLDARGIELDFLVRLAQRALEQVLVGMVRPASRKGDLAAVAPQVGAALGEHEPRARRSAVERDEHRRVAPAVGVHRSRVRGVEQGGAEVSERGIHGAILDSTSRSRR